RDIWSASFATELQVAKRVRLVANVGMERNSDVESDTHPAFSLGGVIYSLTENIDIDAGVKWGINGPEPDISFLAGLAFRF
ncbi:MAG TPA: transporter, partial [Syntrophales bacterium]|nr:transporter [Syntrophales bacterium]